jgi:transglutaminase-like putative cysteine protease
MLGPDPELAGWHLSAGRLSWLCISLVLVIAPHVSRMPSWVSALFAVLGLWRLWKVHRGDDRLPNRWLVVAIALAVVPGVYLSFGTITGRQAGVAMLTLLAGIKLLETRSLRDCYVLSYLGFFLVITAFLFDQDIGTGAYMLLVVVVMTATLHALGASPGHDPRMGIATHLRRGGVLVAQAVPLMLVLFVLFPRIPGPLWGLPKDARSGVTGLSEEMRPGDISTLSESDAVAFRVRFQGAPPPAAQLYWRGPVLTRTDGRRWTRGAARLLPYAVRFERLGRPVDYELTLEPHGRRWLFALDLPATAPRGSIVSDDLQIRAPRDVRERRRYRMRSYLEYRLEARAPLHPLATLELPPGRHPRARALALSWRQELGRDRRIVERALGWLRDQDFVYTLTPPALPGDPVDDFLFGSRQGFCEHYAGAFTVLMRAAGIPARVVTGYQGGELNPIADHLLVRQRDAHAWTEVWLQGSGWTRVDPTAVVAPERIEQGIDVAIPPRVGAGAFSFTPAPAVADTFRRLRQVLDAAQSRWNAWVLGYGPGRQREVADLLGLDGSSLGSLVLALTVALALLLGILAMWMFPRRGSRDPVRRCYAAFCARLARQGLPREPAEGPLSYAARVTARRPELAPAVAAITEAYVALRYAESS